MQETALSKAKIRQLRASSRSDISSTFLKIAFTVFALIISLNPHLFQDNALLSVQIVATIPLLLSSIFARSRLIYNHSHIKAWDTYGTLCFVVAYAMLINSVGILLSMYSVSTVTIIFFVLSIGFDLTYTIIEAVENRENIKRRIWKDTIFVLLIIFMGLLPSLHVY